MNGDTVSFSSRVKSRPRRPLKGLIAGSALIVAATITSTGGIASAQSVGTTATPPPFSALPHELIHGTGSLPTLSSADLQDAQTFASATGIAVSQSDSKIAAQAPWDNAIATIQRGYPESFTGSGRQPDGSGAWVTLKGPVIPGVVQILTALPIDVTLRYSATTSYSQLRDIADAAVGVLQSATFRKVGYVVDDDSGAITVTFTTDLPTVTQVEQSALAAAKAVAGGNLPVALNFDNDPSSGLQPYYAGGASLWRTDGSFDCTSGFNVNDTSQGGGGVVTAGHCDNGLLWGESKQKGIISYNRHAPSAGTTSAGVNKNIDLEYSNSINGQVGSSNFQATGYSSTDRRAAVAAYNATKGDTVCKFGWGASSGHGAGSAPAYNCGSVTTTDSCQQVDSNYNCGVNLVSMTSNEGDSGGPVFAGQSAVGYVDAGSSTVTAYTQQSRLSYMGLAVTLG